MVRVNRRFSSSDKDVIRDISVGFYYGAKIGVVGLNSAGKSTLLRIIAGVWERPPIPRNASNTAA